MTQLTSISAIADIITSTREDEMALIHVEVGNQSSHTAYDYIHAVKKEIATYLVENNITKKYIIACMINGEKTIDIEKITKEEWMLHQLKNEI